MTKGVIYSCAGNIRFLKESIKSANSVKKFMPNISICLFHNYSDTMLNSVDITVFTDIRKIVLPDNNDPKFKGHMGCFLAKLYSIQQNYIQSMSEVVNKKTALDIIINQNPQ